MEFRNLVVRTKSGALYRNSIFTGIFLCTTLEQYAQLRNRNMSVGQVEIHFCNALRVVENVLTKSLPSVFYSVINTPTNQSGKHRNGF
jgi:hypothetical protein